MVEIWRPVLGYEGRYEVSSIGRVRSLLSGGRLMRQQLNGRAEDHADYYRVKLAGNRQRYVHHLVCEAFYGPRPDGLLACHANGNHRDNWLDNLYWGTPMQNAMDMKRHGTFHVYGRRQPRVA